MSQHRACCCGGGGLVYYQMGKCAGGYAELYMLSNWVTSVVKVYNRECECLYVSTANPQATDPPSNQIIEPIGLTSYNSCALCEPNDMSGVPCNTGVPDCCGTFVVTAVGGAVWQNTGSSEVWRLPETSWTVQKDQYNNFGLLPGDDGTSIVGNLGTTVVFLPSVRAWPPPFYPVCTWVASINMYDGGQVLWINYTRPTIQRCLELGLYDYDSHATGGGGASYHPWTRPDFEVE